MPARVADLAPPARLPLLIDLLPALDPRLARPIAWYKTTISCFRLGEIVRHYRDAGWDARSADRIVGLAGGVNRIERGADIGAAEADIRNTAHGVRGAGDNAQARATAGKTDCSDSEIAPILATPM